MSLIHFTPVHPVRRMPCYCSLILDLSTEGNIRHFKIDIMSSATDEIFPAYSACPSLSDLYAAFIFIPVSKKEKNENSYKAMQKLSLTPHTFDWFITRIIDYGIELKMSFGAKSVTYFYLHRVRNTSTCCEKSTEISVCIFHGVMLLSDVLCVIPTAISMSPEELGLNYL